MYIYIPKSMSNVNKQCSLDTLAQKPKYNWQKDIKTVYLLRVFLRVNL